LQYFPVPPQDAPETTDDHEEVLDADLHSRHEFVGCFSVLILNEPSMKHPVWHDVPLQTTSAPQETCPNGADHAELLRTTSQTSHAEFT